MMHDGDWFCVLNCVSPCIDLCVGRTVHSQGFDRWKCIWNCNPVRRFSLGWARRLCLLISFHRLIASCDEGDWPSELHRGIAFVWTLIEVAIPNQCAHNNWSSIIIQSSHNHPSSSSCLQKRIDWKMSYVHRSPWLHLNWRERRWCCLPPENRSRW